MATRWQLFKRWWNTEACLGCPGRVQLVSTGWGGRRRKAAYCEACCAAMGISSDALESGDPNGT